MVPLYREREGVARLFERLLPVLAELPMAELILVDDGSDDGTAEACKTLVAKTKRVSARLLRHRRNFGLTAALRTGFLAGRAPIHCWLDADLSYDPRVLLRLVEAVRRGADLATVSPYHPDGAVDSVPPLRLWLSRGLSRTYRLLQGGDVYTYSAMVRAWRRSVLARCLPRREGHLGVTESLLRVQGLRTQGRAARLVEVPATLGGRVVGRSAVRLVPTVLGHVGLMHDAVLGRLGE